MIEQLKKAIDFEVYDASVTEVGNVGYFLARRGTEKFAGCVGPSCIEGERVASLSDKDVIIGQCNHANALAIRKAIPWTAPRRTGLKTSAGLGDRLGLAGPGHIQAMRQSGRGLAAVLAQQSIREMSRTGRTPDHVMDSTTWSVLQEGFRDGFGSDADHLQKPEDIDATVAAGFTMFTIDPGLHVVNGTDEMDAATLADRFEGLDFKTLAVSPNDLKSKYAATGHSLDGGGSIEFDEQTLLRAAVKYGGAIAHTVKMYERLCGAAGGNSELEVSVDETESPTSPAEHYFFAAELKRLGVEWVSMAPRFVGRFEKGVDYIGDLDAFRASFAEHVAVMRTLGPYKLSIHSGSDKFSIYPILAELASGLVHLKTAGTSYLEALRAIATIEPGLFREVLDFARGLYETDKATYHVSAVVAKVPAAADLKDEQLPDLLDEFNARQVLHVTFGSVLTAEDGEKFRTRICETLKREEQMHYAVLARHLGKHLSPFAKLQ